MTYSLDLRITGKHAAIIKKYSGDKTKAPSDEFKFVVKDTQGKDKIITIFSTYFQCFEVSAMLGIVMGEKIEVADNSTDETGKIITATILSSMLNQKSSRQNLERIYAHLILDRNEGTIDSRIRNAFSFDSVDEKTQLNEITSYSRAGLEFIDSLFKDCQSYEDVCNSLIALADKINDLLTSKSD